jgi:hypothetical protein
MLHFCICSSSLRFHPVRSVQQVTFNHSNDNEFTAFNNFKIKLTENLMFSFDHCSQYKSTTFFSNKNKLYTTLKSCNQYQKCVMGDNSPDKL